MPLVDTELQDVEFVFSAVLYYDYLLTLPLEVQFLWSPGNQGWLTLACLTNRYLPLFGHIPLAVSYFRSQRVIPVRPRSLIRVATTNLFASAHSVVSYCDTWLDEQRLIKPPHSCQGLHLYHEVFGIFMQSLAGRMYLDLSSSIHVPDR